MNGRSLGPGQPCFLVAEAGINHNGDLKLARALVDAAAEAGADAIKFQNYRVEDFILDRSLTYEYLSQGKTVIESQYEMFRRCQLDFSQLRELKQQCTRRKTIFFSTPVSEAGLGDLLRLKVPLLKNGSDCLGHLPLIRAMARTGLPTVISTGMAVERDIAEAVTAFRRAGGNKLILMHCTSSYPTPARDVNLRKIPALAAKFRCPVAFSDHSEGLTAALGAVALGACMIEKHFTLDKNLPGPDHRFSADAAEFRSLVNGVRQLEEQLGEAALRFAPSERANRLEARLSCAAARDLESGHVLRPADTTFSRPGTGIPPKEIERLHGRRLRRAVSAGVLFRKSDFGK